MENKKTNNENGEKKGIIKTVADGFKESAKTQHEITKVRHELSIKTPAEAGAEFKERHAQAKKPAIQKQQEELEQLQEELKKKKAGRQD